MVLRLMIMKILLLQPTPLAEPRLPRSGNDRSYFGRSLKGVPMDLRPTNDNENLTGCRLGAGSVSDLVWSFFSSAR